MGFAELCQQQDEWFSYLVGAMLPKRTLNVRFLSSVSSLYATRAHISKAKRALN